MSYGPDKTVYSTSKPVISFTPGSNTQVVAQFNMNLKKRSKGVKEYKLQWLYKVGNRKIEGSTDTVQVGANGESTKTDAIYNIIYNPPSDAVEVAVKVTVVGKSYKYYKNKTAKKNKKTTSATYKGGTQYSDWFCINANKTAVPSAPSASLNAVDNLQLDFEITDDNLKNTDIQFQVWANNDWEYYISPNPLPKTNVKTVKASCRVNPGNTYKVRCRGYSSTYNAYSDWSGYSSDIVTYPPAPTGIKAVIVGVDGTDVRVSWNASPTATSYEIAYTNDPSLFGQSDGVSTVSTSDKSTSYTFANNSTLALGKTWYFQVRAKNSGGESPYSGYTGLTIGKKPSAPTTWSSVTKVGVGETPILYWVHNATDGSSQTWAQIMVTVNGSSKTLTWHNTRVGDERDATVEYKLDVSDYAEGSKIYWKVRTKGAMTSDQYWSDWSEERTISIYPKPTISLDVNGTNDSITSFPIKMGYITGPTSQIPVTFHIQIFAQENYWYDTYDGTRVMVFKDDEIFSKIIDTKDKTGSFEIAATDVHFENAMHYSFKCTVYMESGLSASYSVTRWVNMDNTNLSPQVIMSDIDPETMSIEICPYCEDTSIEIPEESDEDSDDLENPQVYGLAENVILDVYRINYDGTFTKINKTQVANTRTTWLHDPHPPLNHVQYRIVATSTITGVSVYNDTDAEPVGTALAPDPVPIIIQWGEQWTDTEYPDESYAGTSDMDNDPTYLGNILKLPYNIDISNSNDKDVECIKYVGRQHPVSYYGTQLGVTSTWKTDVPKDDMDTLSMLRRLSIYMGDCYVREPSGSGYWANVAVSFEQTHNTLVIPVTLTLTRVEGDA